MNVKRVPAVKAIPTRTRILAPRERFCCANSSNICLVTEKTERLIVHHEEPRTRRSHNSNPISESLPTRRFAQRLPAPFFAFFLLPFAFLLPATHRRLNASWGLDEALVPELKHQERPEKLAMIRYASFVLILEARYIFRIKYSGASHALRR